jgi:putative sigma-54 modulation protein
MNIIINFHQMPHSEAIDTHARSRFEKVATLFKRSSENHPITAEFFLNAHPVHAHHEVELRVKSGALSLASHDTNPDMYAAIDSVIEKMVTQVKKEKEKNDSRKHQSTSEKSLFNK